MVGNANANGIPFLKRYGIPPAIKNSMVLWYDIARQGATNENMTENPILKDLSGNGHDATCHNFAWSGMSGVGGYKWTFDNFMNKDFPYSGNTITLTHSDTTVFEDLIRKNELITLNMIPGTSVKVTGMQSGDNILLYSQIEGTIEGVYSPIIKKVNIVEDGIYSIEDNILPDSYVESLQRGYFGFKNIKINEGHEVTVEQLPQYPNALVADGVDDYALVEGLPLLNKEDGFTIIAKRKWISDVNSKSQGFVSKGSNANWIDGAFYFEGVEGQGIGPFNRVFDNVNGQRGINRISSFSQENLTYLTSAKYNNSNIVNIGDGVDTDKLIIFRLATSVQNFYASISLYSLLLFNRDLTDAEIEWVKTNLISVRTNEEYTKDTL